VKFAALEVWRCGLLLLILLGTGCTLLPAAQPDTTHYYVLNAIDDPGNNRRSAADTKLAIGLGPINFPNYLARSDIVTRTAANRVELSTTDRWAEPLDVTFTRILAQDLAAALDGAQVAVFPWFASSAHFDYQVAPVIERFEADDQGKAHLAARWSVIDSATSRVLYATTTDLSVVAHASDHAEVAAALSQLESEFAGEIAAAIRRLRAQPR
jgi:uncharacterized lipoprotein YmbA